MKVLAVVGYRNSGKTTLVERIVSHLTPEATVGTVKSIHHDIEIDTPGKDTFRHREAGADSVTGITPSVRFSISPTQESKVTVLRDTLNERSRDGFDVVVVEGFKGVGLPHVAVGDIPGDAVEGTRLLAVDSVESVDENAIDSVLDDVPDWSEGRES
ncbi:MAG: molybdopterin-guanine dinucleotide biosynthesis protein B [Halodesulfurarchaeum sp.]